MFYLNDTKIEEPAGFQAVYWNRVRHPDYFGIWRQKTARVMGVGEVGFQGEARDILRSLWKKDKINASALFEVRDGDETIYSADVDFGMWSDDGRQFNVSFRDQDVELDTLSSVLVSIDPKILIELPEQPISDGIAYSVNERFGSTFRISGNSHSVPFETSKSGEGNGLTVETPASLEPIYQNSTAIKSILTLEGKIVAKWSGSGNVNVIAQITQDGVVKDSRVVSALGSSGSFQDVFVNERIEIPQGAYLRLIVSGNNNLNVTYSSESFLNIYENAATAPELVWGLSYKQAIEELLIKLTGSEVSLSSTYLSKGLGANRVITSERNLRGYRSGIRLSLRSILMDMNAIDNLAIWKRGSSFFIETKENMISKVGASRILEYKTLVHSPSPFFASSINVGYKNWQSGTAAGRDEFCTERVYSTPQTKIKTSVGISVENLSASGKMMEVLRRNPNTDKADTGQDEKLFVIEATRSGSKYIAKTGNISGVIDHHNVINAGISPRSIMQRWSNIYGVNGTSAFVSGTGNYEAITNGVSESADVKPDDQIFFDRYVMIETGMTIREYSEMGEVIEYQDHDGQYKCALIMDDSYRFSTGDTTIKAIELNE